MTYIERWATDSLESAMRVMRIAYIAGPRQCGKTTLMKKYLSPEKDLFISLDNLPVAEMIRESPMTFLESAKQYGRIGIDEVQKVPELFGGLKNFVDEHQEKGRFILTGSANYRSLPSVNESMAGRLGVVNLRTFSEGEIQGNKPSFLQRVTQEDYTDLSKPGSCSKNLIIEKALAGGYPEPLEMLPSDRQYFFEQYVNAMLDRDLKDVGNFRKLSNLKTLLTILASTSSKIVNDETMLSLMKIDRATLLQYISALKILYLVDEVPAWAKSAYDKVAKTPKRFISDTGLLSALLGFATREDVFKDQVTEGDFTGKLIETWVYCQVAAHVGTGLDWKIHHFRTYAGKEIDLLLEHRRGDHIALEIKGKERIQKSDFDSMNWFASEMVKDRKVHKIVLYTGDHVVDFGDGNFALPMSVLWR